MKLPIKFSQPKLFRRDCCWNAIKRKSWNDEFKYISHCCTKTLSAFTAFLRTDGECTCWWNCARVSRWSIYSNIAKQFRSKSADITSCRLSVVSSTCTTRNWSIATLNQKTFFWAIKWRWKSANLAIQQRNLVSEMHTLLVGDLPFHSETKKGSWGEILFYSYL